MGHDVVGEPDPQRRLGIDEVAGHRNLARLGHPDPARQVDEHGPGIHPDPYVRVCETGSIRRHDEVAGERDLEPAGDGGPVDGGDRRHTGGRHGIDELGQIGETVGAEVAQVEAGAERRVGAGDDDAPRRLAGRDGLDDRLRHLEVDRVACRRTVERDHGHAVGADVDLDRGRVLIAHPSDTRI